MDVRCEKCKTEYEFDDSRISDAGVAVQCTTCGHVFKVKKKAMLVTMPIKPGEVATMAVAAQQEAGGDRQRDWKVRQPNGNLFTFRELTTLQKWIVERKVTRDDEISLTGETWKRLGNIADLASFFQVVEEAQKLEALQAKGMVNSRATPVPAPAGSNHRVDVPRVPAVSNGPRRPGTTRAAEPRTEAVAIANSPTVIVEDVSLRETPVSLAEDDSEVPVIVQHPRPVEFPAEGDLIGAEIVGVKRGGAERVLLFLLVLGAIIAGAYYGYYSIWLPQQAKEAAAAQAANDQERAREKAVSESRNRAEDQAKSAQERPVETESKQSAATPAPAVAVDAGTTSAGPVAAPGALASAENQNHSSSGDESEQTDRGKKAARVVEPVRNFDWYMSLGKKSRERQKAAAALDAYAKAAALRPDRAEPLAGRGYALLDMKDHVRAEASFEEALRLSPGYGSALLGLAEAYRGENRPDKALEYYRKYLEVLPDGPDASSVRVAIQKLLQQ